MKILGIGNAIVDVICKVEDAFIKSNNLISFDAGTDGKYLKLPGLIIRLCISLNMLNVNRKFNNLIYIICMHIF